MTRAGYPKHRLRMFKDLGMDLTFYLTHSMGKAAYDSDWKLHYPHDL